MYWVAARGVELATTFCLFQTKISTRNLLVLENEAISVVMGHLIIFSNLDICCRLVSVKVCGERRWLGIVSIKEVGDTSDRGGGLEEWEGGTYAILIVPNRLLSHRHLHHMGQNYPLSMDGSATFHRHSGCQNFTTISAATMLGQT